MTTLLMLFIGLASSPFGQLPTHGAAARISWTWPDTDRFVSALEGPRVPLQLASGHTIRVDRPKIGAGSAEAVAKRLRALAARETQRDDTWAQAHPFAVVTWGAAGGYVDSGPRWSRVAVGAPKVDRVGEATLLRWTDTAVLVDAAPVPVPDDLAKAPAVDWAYATTLLTAEEGVYAIGKETPTEFDALEKEWAEVSALMGADAAAAMKALRAFPLHALGDRDWRLGQAASFLAANGDPDTAIDLYRRFRPMARCSMDRAPAETAKRYADVCYGAGRISCFLQLQVQIMGDQFDRMIWSSYGEAAASTESKRLIEAGVDARRFLRGLLIDFDGEAKAGWISPWRLARSMHETGLDFEPDLIGLVNDATVDVVNRHRAAQTLWLLWRRAQKLDAAATQARFAQLDLPAASRGWLQAVEEAQSEK